MYYNVSLACSCAQNAKCIMYNMRLNHNAMCSTYYYNILYSLVAIIFGPMIILVCLFVQHNIVITCMQISWKTSLPQSVLTKVMHLNEIIIIIWPSEIIVFEFYNWYYLCVYSFRSTRSNEPQPQVGYPPAHENHRYSLSVNNNNNQWRMHHFCMGRERSVTNKLLWKEIFLT